MNTATNSNESKSEIPRLMDHPEYRREWDKLQQLRLKLREHQDEWHEAQSRVSEAASGGREEQNKEKLVEAALAGKPAAKVLSLTTARERFDRATRLKRECKLAIEHQERLVDELGGKIRQELREQVKPAYQRIGIRVTAALDQLRGALREEHDFREALIEADLSFGPPLEHCSFPGGHMGVGFLQKIDRHIVEINKFVCVDRDEEDAA